MDVLFLKISRGNTPNQKVRSRLRSTSSLCSGCCDRQGRN